MFTKCILTAENLTNRRLFYGVPVFELGLDEQRHCTSSCSLFQWKKEAEMVTEKRAICPTALAVPKLIQVLFALHQPGFRSPRTFAVCAAEGCPKQFRLEHTPMRRHVHVSYHSQHRHCGWQPLCSTTSSRHPQTTPPWCQKEKPFQKGAQ